MTKEIVLLGILATVLVGAGPAGSVVTLASTPAAVIQHGIILAQDQIDNGGDRGETPAEEELNAKYAECKQESAQLDEEGTQLDEQFDQCTDDECRESVNAAIDSYNQRVAAYNQECS